MEKAEIPHNHLTGCLFFFLKFDITVTSEFWCVLLEEVAYERELCFQESLYLYCSPLTQTSGISITHGVDPEASAAAELALEIHAMGPAACMDSWARAKAIFGHLGDIWWVLGEDLHGPDSGSWALV